MHEHELQYTSDHGVFPLLQIPLATIPFLLTWHPPVVTGIVHLSPRLLVNYSLCPPLAPCTLPPKIPTLLGFPPDPACIQLGRHHKPNPQYTAQLDRQKRFVFGLDVVCEFKARARESTRFHSWPSISLKGLVI
jgi:hypothetical protein